jgi:hypothetical protein
MKKPRHVAGAAAGVREDRREPIPFTNGTLSSDPAGPPQRILGAAINEYAALQQFFRRRADELGFSRQTIDGLAGFTPGLASKILAPTPVKRLGHEHLGGFCAALAVALVPIEDAQSLAEIERRLSAGQIEKRDANKCFHAALGVHARSRRFMRRIGASGGHKRAAKLSAKQLSLIGKKAARARKQKLSPERRSEIARNAAKALWAARRGAGQ